MFFVVLVDGSGGPTQTPYRKGFRFKNILQINRNLYRGVRLHGPRPDLAPVFYNMRKQKLSVVLDFKKQIEVMRYVGQM